MKILTALRIPGLYLLSVFFVSAFFFSPTFAQQGVCTAPAPVQHPLENGLHVPHCIPLTPSHYPPTSGKHYDYWANYMTYSLVISPGYYLHDAEHGAVVFLYNCHRSDNCNEDIARLKKIADAFPQDSLCDTIAKHRIVVAGDTVMDTRFAAISWGWSIKSDCLDTAAFELFLKEHYGKGTETRVPNACSPGTDFSDFPGITWCTAPLELKSPSRNAADKATDAQRGERILWQGSLAHSGRLTLEVSSLDGALLKRYDLGSAGPGPAHAAWDAGAFRRGFTAAGAVACRVKFATASGTRLLAESVAFP
jgi:hypothetical protein